MLRQSPTRSARRLWLLNRDPEQQHGQRKPQADDDIGNDDARVNENAEGSRQYQRGIEAGGFGSEQAASSLVYHQKQCQRGDSQRQASGPILRPKDSEAGRHAPVHEGSLFEIADAIGIERDPFMARDHFPRHLGMHRVGIIQQRRAEQGKLAYSRSQRPASVRIIFLERCVIFAAMAGSKARLPGRSAMLSP